MRRVSACGRWVRRLALRVGRLDASSVDPGPSIAQRALPPDLRLEAAALTHEGRVRAENQDAVLVEFLPPHGPDTACDVLAIVADGMGGHAAGKVASMLAVETIAAHVRCARRDADLRELVVDAIARANEVVHARASGEPVLRGMGTTVALVLFREGNCCIASVGDSRVYLVRGTTADQLSVDHTPVGEWLRNGVISAEEAAMHPDRNLILRALGTQKRVDADVWYAPRGFVVDDRLLLCSDGLYDGLAVVRLAELASQGSPTMAVRRLVDAALEAGGADNASAVIVAAVTARAVAGECADTLPPAMLDDERDHATNA